MAETLHRVILDPRARRNLAILELEKFSDWSDLELPARIRESIEEAQARSQVVLDTPIPPAK